MEEIQRIVPFRRNNKQAGGKANIHRYTAALRLQFSALVLLSSPFKLLNLWGMISLPLVVLQNRIGNQPGDIQFGSSETLDHKLKRMNTLSLTTVYYVLPSHA